MKLTFACLAGLAAIAVQTAPAAAHDDYDDLFFVRPQATAQAFFQDRADCRSQAVHLGDNASAYTDPQYGALSAMGSNLDEDALHDGGLHKRMQRAVFNDCMKRRGWVPAEPTEAEARQLMKATPRRPELLDAWLKTHEPAPAAIVASDKAVTPTAKNAAAPRAAAPASVSAGVKTVN